MIAPDDQGEFSPAAVQSATDVMNAVAAAAAQPLPIALLLTRSAAALALHMLDETERGFVAAEMRAAAASLGRSQ